MLGLASITAIVAAGSAHARIHSHMRRHSPLDLRPGP
jgi:hypothetical protein